MEKKVKEKSAGEQKRVVRLLKDNNSILILVIMLFVAFVFVDGYRNSFYNVIKYTAMYGPVCLGLALVMITGNIDLSAGFQAGLSGVTLVIAFNAVYAVSGNGVLSLIVGLIVAILTGALCGVINGFFVAKVGIPALIATIASNYAFQGIVYYFAKSSFAPEDANIVKLFAQTKIFGLRWFTPAVIVFVIVVALVFFWMYKTRFGNRLHVVGDNPEAAAYAGINVQGTVWVAYVLCGVLSALTGFVMVSQAGYAIYTQGSSLSTLTISCCVIGGIKMTGGKGTAVHVLIGVLIMRVISQMMTSLFLPQYWVNLITGALLIVVLVIDRFTSGKSVDEL
ncbi:MAG: ABC transporter permease [Oscillospiraceae bacterium]|nr:ABC transporter permease [Oscillospiraceae bacterium]